jgi:hypothetical protein
MTTDETALAQRATALFASTGLIAAITVGAMQVSGWHAGSLDNRVEWIFWAGAILGGVGIGLLGVAAIPGRAAPRLITAGMALFLVAPALCVIAVFANYWI